MNTLLEGTTAERSSGPLHPRATQTSGTITVLAAEAMFAVGMVIVATDARSAGDLPRVLGVGLGAPMIATVLLLGSGLAFHGAVRAARLAGGDAVRLRLRAAALLGGLFAGWRLLDVAVAATNGGSATPLAFLGVGQLFLVCAGVVFALRLSDDARGPGTDMALRAEPGSHRSLRGGAVPGATPEGAERRLALGELYWHFVTVGWLVLFALSVR